MQTQFTNERLQVLADGSTALANQFDKNSLTRQHLLDAGDAVRELLFFRQQIQQTGGGECIYISAAGDAPGSVRPGEPLARPFAVGIYPYAKWIIMQSAVERAAAAEAKLAAIPGFESDESWQAAEAMHASKPQSQP